MALTIIGTLPLGSINVAAGAALTVLPALLISFDAALFGGLGLGNLEADLSFQLSATIQANLQLSNPFDAIRASIDALVQVSASLNAMLALPSISLTASLNISANVSLAGQLSAKLGGLQALISAAIQAKVPVIDLIATLSASIGASCVLASFGFSTPDTLSTAGSSINGYFQTGFEGILPSDQVFGVLILTKQPSASVSLSAMIKVV